MSQAWKYLVAAGIGVIITYGLIQSRLQALEATASRLERGVNQANARVVEFESRYRIDIPQLQYQYQLTRRDVDELKKSALTREQKIQLEETLQWPDQTATRKSQQETSQA